MNYNGVLDRINNTTIEGWVFGSIAPTLYIDNESRTDVFAKYVPRPDVESDYIGLEVFGFSFDMPSDVLDGFLHTFEIRCGDTPILNSPAPYRYCSDKFLFVHVPKTGGTSIVEALRAFKSSNGLDHIQRFNFAPGDRLYGINSKNSLLKPAAGFDTNVDWLSGHICLNDAACLIYSAKRNYFALARTLLSRSFSRIPVVSNGQLADFKVVSIVRDPIKQLISQINWLFEIVHSRPAEFFYDHPLGDIAKIAYYVSHESRTTMGLLSLILNTNILNMQSRALVPEALYDFSRENIKKFLRRYSYVGRLENFNDMMKYITFPEIAFAPPVVNITSHREFCMDDLEPALKDFLIDQLRPDIMLYECVGEIFG